MILLRNTQRVLEQRQHATKIGTPINEVMYNPATWSEWTLLGNLSNDASGIVLNVNAASTVMQIGTSLKPSTKYGMLLNVVSNTANILFFNQLCGGVGGIAFTALAIGNRKSILFTPASIVSNIAKIGRNGAAVGQVKLKDIRLFELPTGSQIEADFTNLTADQLNLKYPYAGYTLLDRSRFANNGVFSNVSWVQLPSGAWVMNFNGVDSYVEIPDSPTMRMAQGGSILAWVYARTGGESGGRIIDKGTDADSTNGYQFALGANNTLTAKINAETVLVSSNNVLPFSAWKLVTVTFSPTGRKIIVNGVDVTASGGAETALPPNVAGNVRIGNRAGATDRTWDGYIGGVRLLSKVLTIAEILRIYNSERYLYGV